MPSLSVAPTLAALLSLPSLSSLLSLGACSTSLVTDDEVSVTATSEADAAKADANGSLSSANASTVLKLIDDACGDAWCEGDFGWAFKKLACNAGQHTCTLTTLVTRPAFEAVPAATFWRSCKMTGVSRFTQMVSTAPNGFQSLTAIFFDKVDACASKIEASIPAS